MEQAALLYEHPLDFAKFMVPRLEESLNAELTVKADNPWVYGVKFHDGTDEEVAVINLFNAYDTYRRTGDLNSAIEFLNNMMRTTNYVRKLEREKKTSFDPTRIFPALRPSEQIKQMRKDGYNVINDPGFPGLDTVYIQREVGFTMVIQQEMLELHPKWTKERLKEQAYRNLRKKGWKKANLRLPSPECDRSVFYVYLDPPVPMHCQLLLPEMTSRQFPESFIAAFPNKETTIVLASERKMSTIREARAVARDNRLAELVERSFRVQPYPMLSEMFWINQGKPVRL